jgi:F-type H+-transporting ATPase subunit epsilon
MFKLNFATPEKKVITDQELVNIIVPAFAGELDILEGHSPLMTTLEPGILKYTLKNGDSQSYAIGWGYCQVSSEGVNILAEAASTAAEVDVKAANEDLKQEEAKLAAESLDDGDWQTTQHEIARLKAELDLADRTKLH